MGYIANLKCEKCRLNETFRLGQGRKEIGIEKVVGYCERCQKFDVYTISYEFRKDGQVIETMDSCSCGNNPTIILNNEIHDKCKGYIECPKCKGNITVNTEGHYD